MTNANNQEWKSELLGSCLDLNTEQSFPSDNPEEQIALYSLPAYDQFKNYEICKASSIESNKFAITKPCVLVSKLNPRKPRVLIANPHRFKTCASTEFMSLVPNSKKISLKYAFHFLSSDEFQGKLQDSASGSTNSHVRVSPRETLQWTILLPPIKEQQKIAEILTSVDEVIENTQSQINKLEDLKKATMNELLTKGIGHKEFKETEIGRVPKSWEVCTLEELSEYRRGSFPQPYGLPKWFSETGYPFVQVFDISDNGRLKESTKEKISDLAAEKSVFVKKGSLIVSLQGSIGRIAITHYDAYVDRTILIFTKFHRPIDLTYFSQVIERLFAKKKDEADGGVIKTITKETLSNFQVALPPIEEQRRISSVLRDHSDRIADLRQKYIGLRNLKVSLMQDLLTGKVRVTVN